MFRNPRHTELSVRLPARRSIVTLSKKFGQIELLLLLSVGVAGRRAISGSSHFHSGDHVSTPRLRHISTDVFWVCRAGG